MKRLALAVTLLVANVPFAFAQHQGTPQEQNACSRDASRAERMLARCLAVLPEGSGQRQRRSVVPAAASLAAQRSLSAGF